jgi:hypothetical protein
MILTCAARPAERKLYRLRLTESRANACRSFELSIGISPKSRLLPPGSFCALSALKNWEIKSPAPKKDTNN